MTFDISHFFNVPPAAGAAPKDCIRVTSLSRKGEGSTTVFRLDAIEDRLMRLNRYIDLESDKPSDLMRGVGKLLKARNLPDDERQIMALTTYWCAKQSNPDLKRVIDLIAQATGRVALLARESKGPTALHPTWSFAVGVERGTNELRPIGINGPVQEEKAP